MYTCAVQYTVFGTKPIAVPYFRYNASGAINYVQRILQHEDIRVQNVTWHNIFGTKKVCETTYGTSQDVVQNV
jgi:hypothetical protein